jgi:hypothetical protein
MKTSYRKLFTWYMILLCIFSLQAQVSTYTFSQFMGTYSAISGGTVFNTPTSDDENIVNPSVPGGVAGTSSGPGMPVGFNFIYNNNVFDQMAVSNNGFIMFGNSAQGNSAIQFQTSGANDHLRPISFTSTSPPANQHRIAALGNDLQGQTGSDIRLQTLGVYPTRTFVAQWTNYRVYNSFNNGDTLNFQIRLYETTNIIDVIYGKVKSVTLDTTAQVGLRGGSNADYNNRSVTGSLTWPTSVAGTANNYFGRYNANVYPPNGLTYRWSPAQCSGTPTITLNGLGLICPGGTSTVNVNNSYSISGITYTWMASTSSSLGPYSSITNANSSSYATPSLTQTTWYQAVYTCINSSATNTSSPFEVQIAGTAISSVPYFEGFEGISVTDQLPNCSWLRSNATVCQTYTVGALYNRLANTGSKFASFKAPTSVSGDYFYSNGIQLYAGVTYSAALYYIADGLLQGWSEISIKTGTAQSAGSMTNIVTESPALSYTHKLLSNTFTVGTSGIYYVGIKCVGSSSIPKYLSWDDLSITIPCNLNPVNITLSTTSTTLCSGQSATMSVTGADTYTWSNGFVGNPQVVTPNINTNYSVTGSSTVTGCTNTALQAIGVYPTPPVAISASSNTLCAGRSATLYAVGANSYIWSNSVMNYYNIVTPSSTSSYTVQGSNQWCTMSAIVTVSVILPANITITSDRNTICVGEEVDLHGHGGTSYQWFATGSPLRQGTDITIQPGSTITYTVVGTDVNGCTNTATFQQKVSLCESLSEFTAGQNITIYPNPNNGEISVSGGTLGDVFEIHTITGSLIKRGELTSENVIINLTDISPGVYYLSVKTENSREVVKIVKQ